MQKQTCQDQKVNACRPGKLAVAYPMRWVAVAFVLPGMVAAAVIGWLIAAGLWLVAGRLLVVDNGLGCRRDKVFTVPDATCAKFATEDTHLGKEKTICVRRLFAPWSCLSWLECR